MLQVAIDFHIFHNTAQFVGKLNLILMSPPSYTLIECMVQAFFDRLL